MTVSYQWEVGDKVCLSHTARKGLPYCSTVSQIILCIEDGSMTVKYKLADGYEYEESEVESYHEALGTAMRFYLFEYEKYKKMQEEEWEKIEKARWGRIKEEERC